MEKQYSPHHSEPALQKLWQDRQIYKAENNPGPAFSIDTPPPTVSGSLHIGHVFSYTHTDITARYKRMSGCSVVYPFGFDDNGLPTERFVEKKLGIRAEAMKRSEFITICLQETEKVEHEFQKLWQRLGFSVDWDLNYSTISPSAQKISQESFVRLYEKGFIYRQYEPALYCTTCKTSVAQAELDDAQQETILNDISFMLPDRKLTIATTRPEFLPACVAVLYHPDDVRYTTLADKKIKIPLFDIWVPLLADEAVDPEKGTGLVMLCIFGDKQDVIWAKKFNIPYQDKQTLGLDGKFNERAGILAGLTVHQARQKIIELLKESGLLINQKPIINTVNVHERCKKNIEYIALAQWFVKILPYKQEILLFADSIRWHPEFMKSRFVNWVESIGWDWCISRQRFFGIPFPVWHCKNCQKILVAPLEALPIDPQEKSYFKQCAACGSSEIIPDADVMDTWNTSSLTPQIVAQLLLPAPFDTPRSAKASREGNSKATISVFDTKNVKNILPMSMRPQAHDIIRTWAFYTITKAWMHYRDIVPWYDVVISGHVLSDAKEKLSKSKENSKLAPENLLTTYSADAIRYWTASARLGHDVAFSENQLKIGSKLVTKLWNAFRFIDEHKSQAPSDKKPEMLGAVNEWILHEFSHVLASYRHHMDLFETGLALQSAEQFFWELWCDNYLEIIKDQLFNPDRYDSWQIAATRWTLTTAGLGILQLFSPYLVHVTEQIYQDIYALPGIPSSLHQTKFSSDSYKFEHSKNLMGLVLSIIKQIRRLKTEHQISLKTPLLQLTIHGLAHQTEDLRRLEQLIRGVTQAQVIMYHAEQLPTASSLQHEESGWSAIINSIEAH
jgi:valyl-tRNA synthetase